MASAAEDFETSELDSIINVIGLTPSDPLDTFAEMWYQVFLWALFSSLFVHLIAAGIAFGTLRKHKLGRFMPLLIVIFGVVAPLTGGVVTSKNFNYCNSGVCVYYIYIYNHINSYKKIICPSD
ncbi:transmembrane protein 170A-like [Centruroides sculpturatus]|uniref:transmembrane protein 170A-like n=1 Tax=Centruroides sculpturatus TaxID=218467 RepID=UPI000C6D4BF2|nr:transmembrane protein 170A-like [Centruroides sculpturatus]XP_023218755.1 transmembrane protein 170A-like [Centruroides sculpturatus]XP_023218756.1 transmembrane protein 170A-like [Centruroides sculpturatus]